MKEIINGWTMDKDEGLYHFEHVPVADAEQRLNLVDEVDNLLVGQLA